MVVVLAVLACTLVALLVLGALTGRVRVDPCCSVADPRRDLRMRAAFEDEEPRPGT